MAQMRDNFLYINITFSVCITYMYNNVKFRRYLYLTLHRPIVSGSARTYIFVCQIFYTFIQTFEHFLKKIFHYLNNLQFEFTFRSASTTLSSNSFEGFTDVFLFNKKYLSAFCCS